MKRMSTIMALVLSAAFALSACTTGGGTTTTTEATTEAATQATTEAAEDTTEAATETSTEASDSTEAQTREDGTAIDPDNILVYGSTTQVNADMMSGWTNIAANAYIKGLIHGQQDTYQVINTGEYKLNERIVESLEPVENEDGTKTFTFTLTDDRVWNDGEPITARDYVFYILLTSHPHFAALDANAVGGYDYVGYDEYNTGDSNVFTGVRLLGEQSFSVTVKADLLPQYNEFLLTTVTPYPFHHLAPGVTLADDGEGAYLSEEFTAELVQTTLMDPETGYRYNPTVTCGPYQFVSYNTSDYTAIIDTNPLFCGTYDGVMPSIERIIFKMTIEATEMQELEAESVHLLTGVSTVDTIEQGLDMLDRQVVQAHTYNRSGYGQIRFHCDQGPTSFQSVRQAIGFLLDREEFNRQYASGYAITVDSSYSPSQYIYQENQDYLEETLIHYTLDPERAVEILEADGWMMGEDGIRHKEVDGEDMPLVVEWLSSTDNPVSDLLRTMLIPEAEKVGMRINETAVTSVLDDASRNNVRDEDAQYFMFNMAINFGNPYSPWDSYSDRPEYWGGNYNSNFILDDVLIETTRNMYYGDSSDKEAYDENWLKFLVRFNELLPNIPLYSNTYFDFYNNRLQNYNTNTLYDARYALVYASLAPVE